MSISSLLCDIVTSVAVTIATYRTFKALRERAKGGQHSWSCTTDASGKKFYRHELTHEVRDTPPSESEDDIHRRDFSRWLKFWVLVSLCQFLNALVSSRFQTLRTILAVVQLIPIHVSAGSSI